MDISNIIIAGISAAGTVGVAIVGMRQHREHRNNSLREEGSLIQMEMSQASLNLARCTAKAVMCQEVNGDMEEAMNWAKKVDIKYNEYSRRICQEFKGG